MAKLGEQQVIVTWKDVSVELPEDGQEVIVALLDETIVGSGKFVRQYDHAIYEEHKDQGYIDSEGRCWDTRVDWPEGQRWWVTHWMSMPEIDDSRNPYHGLYLPEKPTATAQEVMQWSDEELSRYAVRLINYGINYPQTDFEFIESNLKLTRKWLKECPRIDASLEARCKIFNIKL